MYILSNKDVEIIKMLGRVSFVTPSLYKYMGITQYSIDRLIQNGYIHYQGVCLIKNTISKFYAATEMAQKIIREQYGIYIYNGNINQAEHDYYLAKVYCSLSPEEKETWKTEIELRENNKDVESTVDAVFIKDNKKYGVEVITKSYTKEKKKAKMRYIAEYCDKSIVLYTYKKRVFN